MKYNSSIGQLALFFVLLLICVKCRSKFKQYAFSHYLKEIDTRMKTYRMDFNKTKIQLENFSIEDCETNIQERTDDISNDTEECKNKILKIQNLKNNLPKAANLIENFDSYYKDLTKDFWRMFDISQANKRSLYKRDNIRKKIGYNLMEALMNNFMNPVKIRGILKIYAKLLKINGGKRTAKNKISFLEKYSKPVKGTSLKIWSSYRLEEIISNEQLYVKGENVAKTCISNFLSNMQPSFCWKEFHLLGHPGGECPKNYTHLLGACLENCQEGYSYSGGLCLKNCEANEIDCGAFCGQESCQSSSMTAKESYVPNFKSIKDEDIKCTYKEYKDNYVCVRDCKFIGLENCNLGTCAYSKDLCLGNLPETSEDFDKYFVNYLGYIFSLRSNKPFGYSDPQRFNETLEHLVNYSEKNYNRIRQSSSIMLKLKNDKELNYWFFRTIKYNMLNGHVAYPDKERWKMVDICRKVAANWLAMADTNAQPFDFNSLKQPFDLVNWKVCESFDRKDVSQCVKQITDLIKRIGANDLPGITAEFIRPSCRLYL
jgi:hypothetical protein